MHHFSIKTQWGNGNLTQLFILRHGPSVSNLPQTRLKTSIEFKQQFPLEFVADKCCSNTEFIHVNYNDTLWNVPNFRFYVNNCEMCKVIKTIDFFLHLRSLLLAFYSLYTGDELEKICRIASFFRLLKSCWASRCYMTLKCE